LPGKSYGFCRIQPALIRFAIEDCKARGIERVYYNPKTAIGWKIERAGFSLASEEREFDL